MMAHGCCPGNMAQVTPEPRLDTGKKCCTLRVGRHWHRLPTEAVAAPSLEGFKATLDGALGNLG